MFPYRKWEQMKIPQASDGVHGMDKPELKHLGKKAATYSVKRLMILGWWCLPQYSYFYWRLKKYCGFQWGSQSREIDINIDLIEIEFKVDFFLPSR